VPVGYFRVNRFFPLKNKNLLGDADWTLEIFVFVSERFHHQKEKKEGICYEILDRVATAAARWPDDKNPNS
jgi:hypothetical protein